MNLDVSIILETRATFLTDLRLLMRKLLLKLVMLEIFAFIARITTIFTSKSVNYISDIYFMI